MSPLAIALISFAVLLFIGVPIVFTMGISSVVYCLAAQKLIYLMVVSEKMLRGMDSFVLLAIPLFMMCGEVMNRGGITTAIVRFSDLIVGRLRGGLAYVNTLSSTFFAGVTGSALSDVASLGSIMIPAMDKQGYENDYSCAVTAATAIQGPLIPPSIPAVLLASATGLSTGALFLGGAVPGLMIGLGAAIIITIQGKRRNFPKRTERIPPKEALQVTLRSILPLMTVIIIMVGMSAGFFTPTEAASVALVYALFITTILYRRIPLKELFSIVKSVVLQTSTIYLIIAGATMFSWVLAIENVPTKLANMINTFTDSRAAVLLIINLILLFWGMFMDTSPSILVLVPILYPIATSAGINPIHFGVLVIVNLMIGLLTPPFGMALFTVKSVGKCSLGGLMKELWPFIVSDMMILVMISVFPNLVLTLPRMFGLTT